jgi:hypothetical protein
MTLKKLLIVFAAWMMVSSVAAWAEEGKPNEDAIDIMKMTCKHLMSGDDRDREVGVAFFHGYLAGKNNNQVVDLPKASALSSAVRDYCLSNPTSTVMDAFEKAGK